LAEVDPFGDDLPVAGAERPREADRAVMRVNAARQDDARSGHLCLEAADVREERVAALDVRRRIRVDALVRPRALERAPAGRRVRIVPRRGVESPHLIDVGIGDVYDREPRILTL